MLLIQPSVWVRGLKSSLLHVRSQRDPLLEPSEHAVSPALECDSALYETRVSAPIGGTEPVVRQSLTQRCCLFLYYTVHSMTWESLWAWPAVRKMMSDTLPFSALRLKTRGLPMYPRSDGFQCTGCSSWRFFPPLLSSQKFIKTRKSSCTQGSWIAHTILSQGPCQMRVEDLLFKRTSCRLGNSDHKTLPSLSGGLMTVCLRMTSVVLSEVEFPVLRWAKHFTSVWSTADPSINCHSTLMKL